MHTYDSISARASSITTTEDITTIEDSTVSAINNETAIATIDNHVATMMAVEDIVRGTIKAYAHSHHASIHDLAPCVGVRPRSSYDIIDEMTDAVTSRLETEIAIQTLIGNVASGNRDYFSMLLMTVTRAVVNVLDGVQL